MATASKAITRRKTATKGTARTVKKSAAKSVAKATAKPRSAPVRSHLPREIGYVMIWSADMKRARAFYEGTLGIPPAYFSEHWAEFATGGTTLAIHPTDAGVLCVDGTGPSTRLQETGISFRVDDLDATVAALRERGVRIVQEPREVCEGVRTATFADPDGNVLGLAGR